MKTMRLSGGDLVIGANSDLQMVTGADKVEQDMRCALLEPLGNDRFHPGWGSSLDDFISRPIVGSVESDVLAEVNRVVGNYAAVQRDKIESQMLSGADSTYTTDEVVSGVTDVTTHQTYDTVAVKISIGTVSGQTVTLSESGA